MLHCERSNEASGSSPTTEITVQKAPSTILVSVSPSKVSVDASLTVSALIMLAHGNVTITLRHTKPGASIILGNVSTNPDGYFSEPFNVDAEGLWSVAASWRGDRENAGHVSPIVFFSGENSASPTAWILTIIILLLILVVTVTAVLFLVLRRGSVRGEDRD